MHPPTGTLPLPRPAPVQYTSEIFLGGRNTIVMHNTCEVRQWQHWG